jgi:large subunit ribosomal protein L17
MSGIRGYRKLGKPTAHRNLMLRNQVKDLIKHGSIRTTAAKAKETRRSAERMITLGKAGTLHARRMAMKYLNDKDITKKIFDDIGPRYKTRPGGYTRMLKLGRRLGDGAEIVQLELIAEAE